MNTNTFQRGTFHLPLPNWMRDFFFTYTFSLDGQIHRGFLLHLTSTHIFIRTGEKKVNRMKSMIIACTRWHFYTLNPRLIFNVFHRYSPPSPPPPPPPKAIKLILYRLRLSFPSQTYILWLQQVSLSCIMSLLLGELYAENERGSKIYLLFRVEFVQLFFLHNSATLAIDFSAILICL